MISSDHPGSPKGLCAAPYTSLRFEPDGRVSACCINGQYPLGAENSTIREIWDGGRLARLRTALDNGDYSLGCMPCEADHRAGNRNDTQAVEFDHLVNDEMGRWPQRLEFALSNVCNLQCVMCNGELSSSIRSLREHRPPLAFSYRDEFFRELEEFLPHIKEAAFLGGEPFLSRDAARVWDLLIDLGCHPKVDVTTNATVLNHRVESYIERLRMNVAVSLDGTTATTFEAIRVGADFNEVTRNVARLRQLTRSYGGSLVINHCLMTLNWREFPDLLLSAEQLEAPVTLIAVTYPRRFSLFDLPSIELEKIARFFESQDARLRSLLTLNLDVWQDAKRRLDEAAVSDIDSGGSPVPVNLSSRRVKDVIAELERRVEELQQQTGSRPVIVDVENDIVVSVADQTWASELQFCEHVQRSLLRLLPELCQRIGIEPSVSTVRLAPGISSTTLTATRSSGSEFTLRTVMGEWEDGTTSRVRLAISMDDGLPS